MGIFICRCMDRRGLQVSAHNSVEGRRFWKQFWWTTKVRTTYPLVILPSRRWGGTERSDAEFQTTLHLLHNALIEQRFCRTKHLFPFSSSPPPLNIFYPPPFTAYTCAHICRYACRHIKAFWFSLIHIVFLLLLYDALYKTPSEKSSPFLFA